jgi:hypothetical protein
LEERLGDMGHEWFLVLLDSAEADKVAKLALIMWRAYTVRNKVTRAREALSIDATVEYVMNLTNQL